MGGLWPKADLSFYGFFLINKKLALPVFGRAFYVAAGFFPALFFWTPHGGFTVRHAGLCILDAEFIAHRARRRGVKTAPHAGPSASCGACPP